MEALAQSLSAAPDIPVPLSADWAATLLLTIVWIFVAAAVVGPVLRFFRFDRRFRESS